MFRFHIKAMDKIDMTPPGDKRPDGRMLRWTIRAVFVLCLIVIMTVIMSEPRIAGQIQKLVDMASERVSVADTAADEADTPDELARPKVSVMPSNSVPVRRLGDSN